jgi:hypothetical protein
MIKKKEEIDEMISRADEIIETQFSKYGMCYEEGVKIALQWAMGYIDEEPIDKSETEIIE